MYNNNELQIEYKGKVLENVTNLKYFGSYSKTYRGCYVTMFNPLLHKDMKAIGHLL